MHENFDSVPDPSVWTHQLDLGEHELVKIVMTLGASDTGWGMKLQVSFRDDVRQWLDENAIDTASCFKESTSTLWFKNAADGIQFKLVWL